MEAKYGSERGGWRSRVRAGSHGMGLWKFISKEWYRFSSHIRLIMGMAPESAFGGRCGVEVRLSWKCSRGYIV